jgi:two-component system LytT family response regulator
MNETYVISDHKKMHAISLDDILWIKADGACTVFFCRNNLKYTDSKHLKIVLLHFDATRFIKIHKSYVVNIRAVKFYERGRSGTVTMSDGTSLPVSEAQKSNFLKHFRG